VLTRLHQSFIVFQNNFDWVKDMMEFFNNISTEAIMAIGTSVMAVATIVIAIATWTNNRTIRHYARKEAEANDKIQEMQKKYYNQQCDLYKAIVISNFVANSKDARNIPPLPEEKKSNFIRFKNLFDAYYDGNTPIFAADRDEISNQS